MSLSEKTRNRLVLENCEMSYCISESLKVPIVLDFHHDAIYNSSEPIEFYFDRVFKVWNDRGIKPKVHVSNSVSKTDYIQFFYEPLLKITFPIDVMLECKMKEDAILRLREVKRINRV
jgi:UV DNA damage endonuclease